MSASTTDVGDIERVDVEITVSSDYIGPGDTVQVRIVATNNAGTQLSFATNSCVLAFEVLSSNGERLFYQPAACDEILLQHVLQPGEALEELLPFDGTGWRTTASGAEAYSLPPGQYELRGGVSTAIHSPSQPVGIEVVAQP